MSGFWERVILAFRCFLSILFHAEIPNDIAQKLVKPPGPVAQAPTVAAPSVSRLKEVERPAPESFDRAVQMLALLQRDGRLIDFLAENISAYPDTQLGAAVRTIHETCRQALDNYVKLEPIVDSEEDQPVTVQAGFDPAAIKLIGNVAGQPPVRGVLRHKGWRVKELNLPPLPQAAGRMVVAPAEVELS
ncbi:MAG: DUF2760 domain-containing protein [Silvibacterium sp.]|jgi:hypothetical protein